MAVNICNSCKFWDEMRIRNRGTCRRFPSTIETAASHWCGEHSPAAQPVAEPKEPKKDKKNVGTV